ncbi:hypothetical protein RYH80_16590 [Halobaculum sp. MBLA0147]|uniref:hypothetical protein n=1 Tax=Halobaculum sp. MBLA0147 TaxID=3079934 RepID=UPI003524E150
MNLDRREFVAGVAAAGLGAVAGCSGTGLGGVGGGGGPARYSDFVASEAVDDGGTTAVSFDWAGLSALGDDGTPEDGTTETAEQTETPTPRPSDDGAGLSELDDPLAAYPVGVLFAGVLSVGVVSNLVGLGRLTEFDGPTDDVHVVGDAGIVFEGEYDTEALADPLGTRGFERVTTYEEVPLYESGSRATVALSEELVVFVAGDEIEDTTAVTRRVIDSEAGRTERYRASTSDYERLVSQFDAGLIESAQYVPAGDVREAAGGGENDPAAAASELDLEGTVRGVASSASLDDDEFVSNLALLFAEESAVPARADVEAALGTEATQRDVTVDGRLVTVTGTYRDTPSAPGETRV